MVIFFSLSDTRLFRAAKYGNAEEIRRYEIQFMLIKRAIMYIMVSRSVEDFSVCFHFIQGFAYIFILVDRWIKTILVHLVVSTTQKSTRREPTVQLQQGLKETAKYTNLIDS